MLPSPPSSRAPLPPSLFPFPLPASRVPRPSSPLRLPAHSFTHQRTHVFPTRYVHGLNATDWDAIASSGYNTVLTYTNGGAHESYALPTPATVATTNSFLDNASKKGVKVILSLKDCYPDKAPNGTDVEALWKATVAAFMHHPALLGWYVDLMLTLSLSLMFAPPCNASLVSPARLAHPPHTPPTHLPHVTL